jgi:Rha family phage regulatory protein
MNDLMNVVNGEQQQTMSSLQIAKLTGKMHKDVMRDIRKMFKDLGENSLRKTAPSEYTNSRGKICPKYNLTYRETMLVVSGYSVKLRMTIIDRWIELENKVKTLPSNQPVITSSILKESGSMFVEFQAIAVSLGIPALRAGAISNKAVKIQTGMDILQALMFELPSNIYDNDDLLINNIKIIDFDYDDNVELTTKVWIDETYSPTELGLTLNPVLNGAKFNKQLEFLGLQTKPNGIWVLTTKGKIYGKLESSNINGSVRKNVRWSESVISLFK